MKFVEHNKTNEQGFALPMVLSILVALIIILSAVTQLVASNLGLAGNNVSSQKALNIAEAGVNYYLWHLSHNPTDFKDGQSTPATPDPNLGYGPYVHNYVDALGYSVGTYTLWIKPDSSASTSATVRSIGKDTKSGFTRTIQAQIGAPSFASYGLVADVPVWFGNTESSHGPIHSNIGVRMDGSSDSVVSSANTTYVPPSNLGGNGSTSRPGVWCDTSVTTPVNCNTRSKADWTYPQPSIDFNQVTGSLCTLKKQAFASDPATASLASLSNACTRVPTTRTASYLPQRSTSGSYSLGRGYLVQLNTNGTYDLYNVNSENDTRTPYTSALSLSSVATGVSVPANGVIFAEDNVWVRTNPTFHGRVTIGAGRLASASVNAEIVIADDVVYSTKNGEDAIGLIAENDITIAPYAVPTSGAFNFEVNGALLAQSGSVLYPGSYRSNSWDCTRGWTNSNQTFSFYGSVATRQTWTWSWLNGYSQCGDASRDPITNRYISGFLNNSTQYDYNLKYSPPPSYPVTSTYNILSWREIITRP